MRQRTCTLPAPSCPCQRQAGNNCSHRPLPTMLVCASHLMAQAAHRQGFGSSPRVEAAGGSSARVWFSSLAVARAALCRLLLQVQPAERQTLTEKRADRAGAGYSPTDIVIVSTSCFFSLAFWLSLPSLFIAALPRTSCFPQWLSKSI